MMRVSPLSIVERADSDDVGIEGYYEEAAELPSSDADVRCGAVRYGAGAPHRGIAPNSCAGRIQFVVAPVHAVAVDPEAEWMRGSIAAAAVPLPLALRSIPVSFAPKAPPGASLAEALPAAAD